MPFFNGFLLTEHFAHCLDAPGTLCFVGVLSAPEVENEINSEQKSIQWRSHFFIF